MARKSKDGDSGIRDAMKDAGIMHRIGISLASAVTAREGGLADLRRLLSDKGLMNRLAAIVVPKAPLRAGEYTVYVSYRMPQEKSELEAVFSKGGVSDFFCEPHAWRCFPSCEGVDRMPCVRTMLVKRFRKTIGIHAAIDTMERQWYRPATHVEAYAFAKAHPEIQCRYRIIAPGSYVGLGCRSYITVLSCRDGLRTLEREWIDEPCGAARFLFVRKEGF